MSTAVQSPSTPSAPSTTQTPRGLLARLRTVNPLPSQRAHRAATGLPTLIAGSVLLLLFVAAVAPGVLAPYDPYAIDLDAVLQPPGPAHPFGTDLSGRDLLSRIIAGTGASLRIGFGAVAVATVLAVVLGTAAGLSRTVAGMLANRSIELLFAFPTVLLGLLIASTFGPGATTLVVAIGIGIAPGYARIVRGQVLAVRNAAYVEAAAVLGHTRWRTLRQHVAPNALRPLIVTVTLGVGQALIWASGLAYLGLGVAPPDPEWGALLDSGRTYITVAWWLEVFPGLAIVVVALTFTTLGRALGTRLERG